jgi:fibronectin-binding autotransporter adhesin
MNTRLFIRSVVCTLALFLSTLSIAHAESNTLLLVDGGVTNWGGMGLLVGQTGTNNSLRVITGGVLTNMDTCIIGDQVSAAYNTALVDGLGSKWYPNNVYVGFAGQYNRLIVTNSALLTASLFSIGENVEATGNKAVITGSGSMLNVGQLYVGFYGPDSSLTVADGAQVYSADNLRFANQATSTGNHILVTGPQSRLSFRDLNSMNNGGGGNHIVISDGALMEGLTGYFGWAGEGPNSALVTGPGSVWTNVGALFVGITAQHTSLTISNGGRVYGSHGLIGHNPGASYDSVTLTGTGSLLECGIIQVGCNGTYSSLEISDGAKASSTESSLLGGTANSGHNTILVTGTGSTWTCSSVIEVGGNSGNTNGTYQVLTIRSNATVSAASVWIGGGLGTEIVIDSAGQLVVGGTLTIEGVLRLDGGTAVVDQVSYKRNRQATPGITGYGTIAGNLTVEPGTAWVLEPGSRIAITGTVINRSVIQAPEGGWLDFYGPVINDGYINNINGNVNFHSTLDNGSQGAVLSSNSFARLNGMSLNGTNFVLSFTTGTNAPYRLIGSTDLQSGPWTNSVQALTGNGRTMSTTNPVGTLANPFWRVELNIPDYIE